MKPFRIAREALIAVFVCSILMKTMLVNILMNKWLNLSIRLLRIYRIKYIYTISRAAVWLFI